MERKALDARFNTEYGFWIDSADKDEVHAAIDKLMEELKLSDAPASTKQVQYVRSLYRKVNFHYGTVKDDNLLDTKLIKDRGIDLSTLTRGQAKTVIEELKRVKKGQRASRASR
jgi:hypothetical protein